MYILVEIVDALDVDTNMLPISADKTVQIYVEHIEKKRKELGI